MSEINSKIETPKASVEKFLKLLVYAYLFFYMFPSPFNFMPAVGILASWYNSLIQWFTIWTGENLLQISKVNYIEYTGSGDTAFDYVKLFSTLLLALLVSMVLFFFTAHKSNYRKLGTFMFIYARYYLAIYLLSYGFAKFYEGQFISPSLTRLEQSIGDASPMGLMWTFMGYSQSYTFFSGVCEVAAGLLLFFRRTTVIGALLSLAVMTNVMVLNFTFDVPVKLFSTHLVLISIFICSPNIVTFIQLFFTKQSVALKREALVFKNKWVRVGRYVLKAFFIFWFPFSMLTSELGYIEEEPENPLMATYFTEEFIINKDTVSYRNPSPNSWNKLIMNESFAKIIFKEKNAEFYDLKVDTLERSFTFKSYEDSTAVNVFNYQFFDDNYCLVQGKMEKDSIKAIFRVKKKEDYQLVTRKFSWIQEFPYNR